MKKTSTLILTFCGGSLLLGCSGMAPRAHLSAPPPPPMAHSRYDSADAAYRAGRQLHQQSRFNEAAVAYQDALALDASHIETKNGMAALIAGRGDLDRAITILTSLAESHPDAPHILANLGYAYYLKGNIAAADRALDQAVSIAPDDEKAWGKLAAVLDQYRLAGPSVPALEPDSALAVAQPHSGLRTDAVSIEMAAGSEAVYTLRYPGAASLPTPAVPEPALTLVTPPVKTISPLPGNAGLPLELANGNGVRGLARSLREIMKGEAWQVVRVVNNDSFKVPVTRIEYAQSYLPAAHLLAEHLGVAAELRAHYRLSGAALRVVLGHDFKSVEAMRQRQETMPLACSSTMVQS